MWLFRLEVQDPNLIFGLLVTANRITRDTHIARVVHYKLKENAQKHKYFAGNRVCISDQLLITHSCPRQTERGQAEYEAAFKPVMSHSAPIKEFGKT